MENPIALGINLSIAGIIVVFVILTLISGMVAMIRLLDRDWNQRETKQKAEALEKPQDIDDLTLVLISAAVATLIKGRHRIRNVSRVTPSSDSSPWSMQGRSVLLGSHSINKANE